MGSSGKGSQRRKGGGGCLTYRMHLLRLKVLPLKLPFAPHLVGGRLHERQLQNDGPSH